MLDEKLIICKNKEIMMRNIHDYLSNGFEYTQHPNQITDGVDLLQFCTKRTSRKYLDFGNYYKIEEMTE